MFRHARETRKAGPNLLPLTTTTAGSSATFDAVRYAGGSLPAGAGIGAGTGAGAAVVVVVGGTVVVVATGRNDTREVLNM